MFTRTGHIARIVGDVPPGQAVTTAFTAAAHRGLTGWDREHVHVLVPGGARIRPPPEVPIRIHWTNDWRREDVRGGIHSMPSALAVAADTVRQPRPACGLFAAAVQQRLVSADAPERELAGRPRVRHRAALFLAVADISQGAHALSEIDFARLCRRGLPEPARQAVRVEPGGRRRYLDAA